MNEVKLASKITFELKDGKNEIQTEATELATQTTGSELVYSAPLPSDLDNLEANDWIGQPEKRSGISAMYTVEDIDFICYPDLMHGAYSREYTAVDVPGSREKKKHL